MPDYPEIAQLKALREKHTISIRKTGNLLCERSYYPEVIVQIDSDQFKLFVDDEFDDFSRENLDLSLCIVLRALEIYNETDDYLEWCRELSIDASDENARIYHMGLRTVFDEIKSRLGKIDSYISDFDFELNAGAAQTLRGNNQQ